MHTRAAYVHFSFVSDLEGIDLLGELEGFQIEDLVALVFKAELFVEIKRRVGVIGHKLYFAGRRVKLFYFGAYGLKDGRSGSIFTDASCTEV